MMKWLTLNFGANAAKWIVRGLAVLIVVLCLMLLLSRCGHGNDQAGRQAEQTTRSSEATANSSASAIGTIENRHDTDANGDAAVIATQGAIANAATPSERHSAVVAGVCRKPSHRNDPACKR